MPTYECKVRLDRVDELKEYWTQPQAPESWVEHVDAGSCGEARSSAYDLFGTVIAETKSGDLPGGVGFSPEWFECVEIPPNQE